MHPGALKALEFDWIIEAVRSFALTPLGATRLAELRPQHEFRRVEAALAATTEGVRYVADNGVFPLHGPSDLAAILSALAIEGRFLEPLALVALSDFLASIEATRTAVRRAAGGPFPIIRALVDGASSFEREIADVRRAIEPSGGIVDDASAELRSVRDRLRRQRSRLRSTLESYLRGKETSRYLQEQIVTDRNGRFVLVVKTENRTAIPGIVHGSSASGASLFLEPLSTVEINNEIVALHEREAEEIRRILLELTEAFRGRAAELTRTLEAATDLDVVQAKACFAQAVDGIAPEITNEGRFEIRAGRHPLLIPAVVERLKTAAGNGQGRAREPVPVDILITPPAQVLLITGPNTGGKTVALKMAGLTALMAQSGLHVPAAEGTRVPVFHEVFADIGDEQSIAANLSTFSWHVTNIAAMDRSLVLPGLILLDEIGVGTDPVEGGALAMAILEHFRTRGAIVLATTHYDMLKSYASTTEGVVAAAFGFDPESFTPTYRLAYGSAGRSLALEIAGRLGLPASIVDTAREYRTVREAQLAEHLKQIDREIQELDHEKRLARAEREAVRDWESRVKSRDEELRRREESFKRRLDERLDDRLREARREIDRILDELKQQAAGLAAAVGQTTPALSTGDLGAARSAARTALDRVASRFEERDGPDTGSVTPVTAGTPETTGPKPVVGDRVTVGGLGFEGVVRALTDREAEVEVRGKRLRVGLDDLRTIGRPATDAAAAVHVSVRVQEREGPLGDLNVIGCTADEARSRAEKFLDEASLAEQRTVRVIHGYGTGQLRRAIAELLNQHPLVARFGSAPPEQGGGGVTVIELKD